MVKTAWIEIPVKDIQRAAKFYWALFELPHTEIHNWEVRQTTTLSFDPAIDQPGISLNQTANFEPSNKGILVYLDCGDDLTSHLNRVEPAGGKIVTGKTSMGQDGFYAAIHDTEGNLIALWSPK
ncbi:MAG: VOC family protein [Chloroflexota bacterium]